MSDVWEFLTVCAIVGAFLFGVKMVWDRSDRRSEPRPAARSERDDNARPDAPSPDKEAQ